jgi:hypothetical protein
MSPRLNLLFQAEFEIGQFLDSSVYIYEFRNLKMGIAAIFGHRHPKFPLEVAFEK